MNTPSISLRRKPTLAIAAFVLGIILIGLGVFLSQLLIVFPGVLSLLFAGLLLLNPVMVITEEAVEMRNVFGIVRARHTHDGLKRVRVEGDCIFIQRGDMRAPLNRFMRNRLHSGDWDVMLRVLAEVQQH